MSIKRTFERAINPFVLPVAGGTAVSTLPPVHYLLGIRFNLSVTCTGITNIHTEALARSVTFRYKFGSSPSISLPGHVLLQRNQVLTGVSEDYTELVAGAGPVTGTWNGFIPRACLHRRNPNFTMDDMSLAEDPTLEVTFGGPTAISRTGGAAVTAITLTASAVMVPRAAGKRIGRVLPHVMGNVTQITDLAASTADQIRRLRCGMRNSLIMCIAETNNPTAADIARSDALVTNLERIINLGRRGKETWTNVRTMNRQNMALAVPTGVAFWDFDPRRDIGNPSDLFDLRGVETFEIGVDTAALANNLRLWVYQEEIVDPDPNARKALGLPGW